MSPRCAHNLTFETENISSDSFEARSRSTDGAPRYGIIFEPLSLISDNVNSAHDGNHFHTSDEAVAPTPPVVNPEIALPELDERRWPITTAND